MTLVVQSSIKILLAPTLSEFEILKHATLIIQNSLVFLKNYLTKTNFQVSSDSVRVNEKCSFDLGFSLS